MRRESYVFIVLLGLIYLSVLIFVWPGLGIELPVTYERETITDQYELRINDTSSQRQIIELGELRAWSQIQFNITADSPVMSDITSSDPSNYNNFEAPSLVHIDEQLILYSDTWYLIIYAEADEDNIAPNSPQVEYSIIINSSSTLDLRIPFLVLLGIFFFLYYRGNTDKFYTFPSAGDPREKLRRKLASKSDHCSYCGTDEINRKMSNNLLQTCSFTCIFVSFRYYLAIAAIIFSILSLWYWFALFLGIPFAYVTFKSLENHQENLAYRNLESIDTFQRRSTVLSSQYPDEDQNKIIATEGSEPDNIYVKEVDVETRICCYQTARLQEKFCRCGRAVDPKLLEYFAVESEK